MIYVISKATFGSYNVRDIQCNANWTSCPYSDYAMIPDDMVDDILATRGYCDIALDSTGTEVASFTARSIPSVPEECCGTNTVLSVNGVTADTSGEVTLTPRDVGARPAIYSYESQNGGDLNTFLNETHLFVFNVTNKPSAYKYGWFDVWRASGDGFSPNNAEAIILQRFIDWQSSSAAWRCSTDNGETFSEWAYDTAPYQAGVEYLTTEFYLGERVKTKVIDCGTVSSGSTISVEHGISYSKIVRHSINVGRYSLPYFNNGDPTNRYSISGYINATSVNVKNGSGNSAYKVYAQVWYV